MSTRKRKSSSPSSNKMWSNSSSSRRKKAGSAPHPSSTAPTHRRNQNGGGWDEDKANEMFDELVTEDCPDSADMEGISKLCSLVSLDPYEDIRVLVLLHKLGANRKPAEIQREEFISGSCSLGFDSVEKLMEVIPSLDTGFLDMDEFRDFYKFCFQFNRAGTHKTLDKDLVIALLNMTLTADSPPRIPSTRLSTFCEFLETTKDESYSKITLDQWRSFLDFSLEFKDDTFEGYDEGESAWPVLIDEYVEFMEKRGKK